MRGLWIGIALSFVLATAVFAREEPTDQTRSVSCTFADGKQISARYSGVSGKKEDLSPGGVYAPGGSPIFLFTETPLVVGKSEIPAGAFSMYLIPDKKKWTLVINKSVTAGSKYDEKQDLVRIPMQIGHVDTPTKQLQVLFVHVSPKQCNIRIYDGPIGAWSEFKEK